MGKTNIYIRTVTKGIKDGQKRRRENCAAGNKRNGEQSNAGRQGNMVLIDKDGNATNETKLNLETRRRYIRQHFTRTQEIWGINCIPNEMWAIETGQSEYLTHSGDYAHKHKESTLQQYANASQHRRRRIDRMGDEITLLEITKSIRELNNRKSLGGDRITEEIIKENQGWLTPIRQMRFRN